ncbi:heavy-metal-associated domain-containing protein [Solihabitans fulvus]|uniref:Heavy-metal-associated domain-containing protein n=1 Tax=Solihabitans fulvus TaxID=1892852 RepID=A0A5B2XDQ6_9PSEU|nr:heavy metal-associated domain-containing protein [Solihabitans fulvus]KAA2261091.1 heavy-metal-associated domain-containing protein [Solihabitans fulvus]
MSTTTYAVKGMTCSGCMNKVTTAVESVSGVRDVDVDISTGEVTVTAEDTVDPSAVRAAVQGAGYEIA